MYAILRERKAEIIVFLIYILGIIVVAAYHEPWYDEVQTWLIARDADFFTFFTQEIRYEGHSSLWYLLNFPFAKAGFPLTSLTALSLIFASSGTALFLFLSPFPLWIRLLYPFTLYPVYQYAVVARNYSLLAPLLFLIAYLWPKRLTSPLRHLLLLLLLSQISLHGLLAAGVLALWHVYEWHTHKPSSQKIDRHNMIGLLVLGLVFLLTIIQLTPPDDLILYVEGTGLKRTPIEMLLHTFTQLPILSLAILIATGMWLSVTRFTILPLLLLLSQMLIFGFLVAKVWHEGILFLLFLFVLWISMESAHKASLHVKTLCFSALTLTLIFHLSWGAQTIQKDLLLPYSGAKDAALYIKEHSIDTKDIFARGFNTYALLPYFERNIFSNFPEGSSYWIPSREWLTRNDPLWVRDHQPDIILLGLKKPHKAVINPPPKLPDYTLVQTFPGTIFYKGDILEEDSFALYEAQ